MNSDLVEPSPSHITSSDDSNGEGETTDDEKWQTVRNRSKRVSNTELESSSTSSQASGGASDASEEPSISSSASKKEETQETQKTG